MTQVSFKITQLDLSLALRKFASHRVHPSTNDRKTSAERPSTGAKS